MPVVMPVVMSGEPAMAAATRAAQTSSGGQAGFKQCERSTTVTCGRFVGDDAYER